VVVLDQGRVAQVGTPEEVFQRPASPYVASFMGAENIVDCDALRNGDCVTLRVPNASQAGVKGIHMTGSIEGPVQVHFRSERASLYLEGAPTDDALKLPGRITQSSYLGGCYRCTVSTDSGQFFIDHPASLASGSTVTVCIPADALHVYAREASRSAGAPA
jgi:ABC-type Fe3+/spermidine/putrescine transport system ATPase subunit